MRFLATLACLSFLTPVACSKKKDGPPTPVDVTGAVQKGPFILGAQVQVNVLDSVGNPTGAVFNTTTTTETGEFSVQVSPSAVDLVTDGFYWNEATWALSGASISMRSLANIAAGGPQQAYVNVLTHMIQRRALNLYSAGSTVDQALAAAQGELLVGIPLATPTGLAPGGDMNLLGGAGDSNAYLLALSCLISQTAWTASDGSDNDAQVQQLINNIAIDLEADGALETTMTEQLSNSNPIDPYECVASLQRRLDDLADTTTVLPDPLVAFDMDQDGDPNATDPDADGDGFPAASDPVFSLATSADVTVAVRDGSNTALRLVGPPAGGGSSIYQPSLVFDEMNGQTLTDVEEAVQASGSIALRSTGGAVYLLGFDEAAAAVSGIAAAAVALNTSEIGELIVTDANGAVTVHTDATTFTTVAITTAVRASGQGDNWVYLDNTGAVRVLETATTTDILGLGAVTVVDVVASGTNYMAITDAGALYRFTSAAPTAVEDTSVTGINSVRISLGDGGDGTRVRALATTSTGLWDLIGASGASQQLSAVPNLTSAQGPLTWGESGDYVYVATDASGDVQLIEYRDDLTLSVLKRPMYVPR